MAHPDRPQPAEREGEIFGLWNPYDEATVNETGLLGQFKTITPRLRLFRSFDLEHLPELAIIYTLHTDGTIDEVVVDIKTNQIVPQTGVVEKINGRIETDPKSGQPVLKYTEVPDPNN